MRYYILLLFVFLLAITTSACREKTEVNTEKISSEIKSAAKKTKEIIKKEVDETNEAIQLGEDKIEKSVHLKENTKSNSK